MSSKRQRARITRVEILSALGSWVLSLVTVASLAAIGWLGHATHWTFSFAGHSGGHPPSAAGGEHHGTDAAAAPPHAESAEVGFPSRDAVDRTGIELVPVESRPMASEVVVSGVVQYDQRHIAQLSSRVPGSVWRVEKHLGDPVRKGDVLLVIESGDVGRLKADFLNALVAYEARREQLAILSEVQGAVMGRQVREAKSAVREARNQLTNAEQALVNLGLDVAVAAYEPLDDDARAARIRVAGLPRSLLETVDPGRVTSNLLPLYAPFDGVVIGREAVAGEVIDTAKPIFEVADVSTMWIVLHVNKEDASRVALGQAVRFLPDGSTSEYESEVAWISTEVDQESRTLEVRAEIANTDAARAAALLRANTFGTGRIEVQRRGTALVVPRSSVQWDGSRWVVFVPAGDATFVPRTVRPVLQQGEFVEIEGDFPGDVPPSHVVGLGSHVLKSQIMLDRMEAGEL